MDGEKTKYQEATLLVLGVLVRACLAGLWLLQKQPQLRLFWWSGFSDEAEVILENV